MKQSPNPRHQRSGLSLPESSLAHALLQTLPLVESVLIRGRSLTDALAAFPDPALRPRVQDLAYTAMRQWGRAAWVRHGLTDGRQLKPQSLDTLLTLALCLALDGRRYSPHALVDQAVVAAGSQKLLAAGKHLVNACLRRFFREENDWLNDLAQDEVRNAGFPFWWADKLRRQLPGQWSAVLAHGNSAPPLVLRVNRRWGRPDDYLAMCAQRGLQALPVGEAGVWLPQPVPVTELPGFAEGVVSVQDAAAQWAAPLLGATDGQRVLDACCAPGGKTGHLLELADVDLLALDADASRLSRVGDNLRRLGLLSDRVRLQCADASRPEAWWDGRPFDAILADVPCSASGVVSRHPDIRWLRRPEDVANMSQLQFKILHGLWSLLKPGGTLLIVTCSIFEEEGPALLKRFLADHPDARTTPAPGVVLPAKPADGPGHDGFFYARLEKAALTS